MTLSNNNLRYLPEIRLNTNNNDDQIGNGSTGVTTNLLSGTAPSGPTYVVIADENSLKLFLADQQTTVADGTYNKGVLTGYMGTTRGEPKYSTAGNKPFCLDQGIVSNGEGTVPLPVANSLYETQYLVEVECIAAKKF